MKLHRAKRHDSSRARRRARGLVLSLLAVPALSLSAAAQTTTDPTEGRLLASNCFQCHGTNGRAVDGGEELAGKSAKSIYEELLEMQRKPANQNIMNVHARGYTPAQIRAIARYLSRQRP